MNSANVNICLTLVIRLWMWKNTHTQNHEEMKESVMQHIFTWQGRHKRFENSEPTFVF